VFPDGSELFANPTWLTTMLDSINDGVIATDTQGCVQYVNKAAEQLTGWSLREIAGRRIEDICPCISMEGNPIAQGPLHKALTGPAPQVKTQVLMKARNGRAIPVEMSASPIIEGGRTIGGVTSFLPISERHPLEATEARALSGYLITAQEEERRRVARELHDDFGQLTTLVEWQVQQLTQLAPASAEKFREVLSSLDQHVCELEKGIREMSHRLHPAVIAELGLPAALKSLVRDFQNHGANINLDVPKTIGTMSVEKTTALYRIAQEALRNAVKHAPGVAVSVTLKKENGELQLMIKDAGPGFDLNLARSRHGLGLLSMMERARLAGATLSLSAGAGEGTLVLVRLPKPADE
jgi:PAS domain S-box-containing protein